MPGSRGLAPEEGSPVEVLGIVGRVEIPEDKDEHGQSLLSVILYSDNHNPMDIVVGSLLKSVSSLTAEEAITIMLDSHNEGKAVVITCPLEHAELYRDRIRTFGLAATTEKA